MQYEGTLLLASNNFPKECSKKKLSESVISTMALDNVSAVVKLDKTILTLGSDLIENRGIEKVGEVTQQMRVLARIVLEGRKVTGNEKANLEDFLKPSQFDTLVQCARNLGGYSEEDGALANRQFKSPSTAGKCGYSLKKAALI